MKHFPHRSDFPCAPSPPAHPHPARLRHATGRRPLSAPSQTRLDSALETHPGSSNPFGVWILSPAESTHAQPVRSTGGKWTLVTLSWSAHEPTPGNYQWSGFDNYLKKVVDAGFNVVISVRFNPPGQLLPRAGLLHPTPGDPGQLHEGCGSALQRAALQRPLLGSLQRTGQC